MTDLTFCNVWLYNYLTKSNSVEVIKTPTVPRLIDIESDTIHII